MDNLKGGRESSTKSILCYDNMGMPETRSVSLKMIAEAASVSAMTVSRVFRHSPQVSPETRDRILREATRLGYQPDPLVSQLMERVRLSRHTGERATIALVREHESDPVGMHHYVSQESVRIRASQHGYKVELFEVGKGKLTPKRLRGILDARGIRGVLLSVSSAKPACAKMDFSGLAVATFGFGLAEPSLHRAGSNTTQGLLDMFEQLEAQGERRIGLAITPWVDLRAGHTYSGALLHYQQSLPLQRRVPLLLLEQSKAHENRAAFERWVHQYRPQAIISLPDPVGDWLNAINIPMMKSIRLLAHDWQSNMTELAGLDHRRDEVASAAVDLIATQLQHNEFGIPVVPRQILIPPRYVAGPAVTS